jgi:hypothetical protein
MRHSVLKLEPGVYKLDRPMEIGSMRVVGARNLVVFPALTTLYRKVHDLLVGGTLNKNLPAPAAEIINISATFEDRPNK